MNKILYFKSKYCGQCRKYSPIIDSLKMDYPDVELIKIDVDEDKELVKKHQITTLPTIILIKNDEVKNRVHGMIPKSKLVQIIEGD